MRILVVEAEPAKASSADQRKRLATPASWHHSSPNSKWELSICARSGPAGLPPIMMPLIIKPVLWEPAVLC
jgi:hypothetical protein